MDGKSGIYRFLILVIAAFAVAGCSVPMGSIGRSTGGPSGPTPVFDGIEVLPNKTSYTKNESFQRRDLEVYTTYQGRQQYPVVPINECEIRIEDPRDSGIFYLVPPNTNYQFTNTSVGWKMIIVRYRDFSYQYPIEVTDSNTDPDPNDTGTDIKIEYV